MDPLSFAASIISVGTLAVQCADSLRKAAAFWGSIQDAPKDIDRLSQESSLLANIFDDIERDVMLARIPLQLQDNYLIAMGLAQEDLKEITDLVDKLSSKLGSSTSTVKRHWAKLQIALKDEKVSKMRKKLQRIERMIHTLELRSLKSMLLDIPGQCSIRILQAQTHTITTGPHQQVKPNTTILPWKEAKASRNNRLVQRSHTFSSVNFLLGAFSLRKTSSTFTITQDRFKDRSESTKKEATVVRSSYVVQLLMGITTCRRGFKLSTTDRFDSWTLNAVRRRPYGSEVFYLCEIDDADGLESLLLRGEASIYDEDNEGNSLLHYAFAENSEKACRLLLKHGCDMYLENQHNMTTIQLASRAADCMTAISEAGFDFFEDSQEISFRPANIRGWQLILTDNVPFMTHNQMEYWISCISSNLSYADTMSTELADLLFTVGRQISDKLNNTFYIQHQLLGVAVINWLHNSFVVPTYSRWVEQWPRQNTTDIDAYLVKKALETVPPFNDYDALQHFFLSPLGGNRWEISVVYMIATYDCGNSPGLTDLLMAKWLELLQSYGVDLKTYAIFEQHLIGEGKQAEYCCRDIDVQLSYEDDVGLLIKVSSELRPEFSHLDPCYLCEPNCPRKENGPAMCLALVDESSRNIRINSGVPGQWDESIKPNQELVVQNRGPRYGIEFFDTVDEYYPFLEPATSD